MPNNINVDFNKISSKIQNEIELRNKLILSKNPNANIEPVNKTASIAEVICISALKAYHEELCQALLPLLHTNHE